ncbi:MAG: DUF3881 family protein [Lachnospiraceae bacterium]|jgi:hypothetical protein|nr:DUF3881 family protein [Lachnospiraceae bacterium]
MHKFLRTVGFSRLKTSHDFARLLDTLMRDLSGIETLTLPDGSTIFQLRKEFAPGLGLMICGEYSENGLPVPEYYFPYLLSDDKTSDVDCSIQRHTERETFAGLLDEYRVGISLIFYIVNTLEYRKRKAERKSIRSDHVCLTGLCIKGTVLLPIRKTRRQIETAKVANQKLTALLEAARNGDEDAIESLTFKDIDLYAQISRRVMREDIYSIVDSSFMPCGVECDQYAVIGEITNVALLHNESTGEDTYDLTLYCSDLTFHVAINAKDLLGDPQPGRRFKGQVWMQGVVKFRSRAPRPPTKPQS